MIIFRFYRVRDLFVMALVGLREALSESLFAVSERNHLQDIKITEKTQNCTKIH